MTDSEMIQLAKDLYEVFGKIRKIEDNYLKDHRYAKYLNKIKKDLGTSTIEMEALVGAQIREDVGTYLDFVRDIDEIKLLKVFN